MFSTLLPSDQFNPTVLKIRSNSAVKLRGMVVFIDSSTSKFESMKPLILRAGVPLALSLGAYLLAKISAKQDRGGRAPSSETDQVNSLEPDSGSSAFYEEDLVWADTWRTRNDRDDELIRLRGNCEYYQNREKELLMRFDLFRELKEKESMLVEMEGALLVEKAYAEHFHRELSFIEAEHKSFEQFVIQYLKCLQRIQSLGSQNKVLQRKAQKLFKRSKAQAAIIKQKNLTIKAAQKQRKESLVEMEATANLVKKLENEGGRLKLSVGELQEHNKELLKKLSLIHEVEHGDYNRLLKEHEELQACRAAEVKELIFLRWDNACLRHEIMRNQIPPEQRAESKNLMELMNLQDHEHDSGDSVLALPVEDRESEFGMRFAGKDRHVHSKKKKILSKLKQWVDGTEKTKPKVDEKDGCFIRHSTSDCALPGRVSCSSV